jgi:hypothetical protein
MLLVAAATVIVTASPLFVVSSPAQSENLKVAQVDIRRDQRIEVGPGGVTVGPKKKQTCRTVTTTVETPDGRKVTKKERRSYGRKLVTA